MIQIVPTILTNDIIEAKEKLKKLQGAIDAVHIDIMDGQFVESRTIQIKDLVGIKLLEKFKIGLHLMVNNPIGMIKSAEKIKTQKIVGQVEMMPSQEKFVEEVIKKKIKAGLALDLETDINNLSLKVLPRLDSVLIMTVKAGWGGQTFKKEKLKDIRRLKRLREQKGLKFKIEVDGGVNEETIEDCIKAGADILSAGSFFWKAKNIKEAVKNLKFIYED